ncbi:transcriptional regulator family: Fungal Specific TF [Penicillium capsulatum]|nr:transcriptional regulator family: Fungal Specific TF [Penicillium capsulatum]
MGDAVLCACDYCHSRKVRCDRQLLCANCTDAGIQCRRTRPHRPSRLQTSVAYVQHELPWFHMLTRYLRISSPGERLFQLDRTVAPGSAAPTFSHVTDLKPRSIQGSRSTNENDQAQPKKRKIHHPQLSNDVAGSPRSQCTLPSPDDSAHHAEQARAIIQSELEGNDCINDDRQSILKSALSFVNTLATGRTSNSDENPSLDIPDEDCQEPPKSLAPSPELLYMILREPKTTNGTSQSIQWPDHISEKTLQKMASAFFSGQAQGQLFYQYCVCVYVKALSYTYQMTRVQRDPHILHQIFASKRSYEAMALGAMRNLNFLNPPSISLIQSMLSAAFLMQHLGHMSHAWLLVSYAARLLTALNYHDICGPVQNYDTNEEAYNCLYWCYYLDRTLSALLHRPLSLPALQISPADLISPGATMPHLPLIRVIMNLAQVQGELLNCGKVTSTRQEALSYHASLQDRMASIHGSLEASRSSVPKILSSDWVATDFCYYAILVDILRSRLRHVFSPMTHKECVLYSRKSLEAFNYLQQHTSETPGFVDPFPSFFAWTVFLYPLSPFFVLFCNIIAELNMDDYRLLQSIVQNLSQFDSSPYIAKLLKLLGSLQNFCTPLIQARMRSGSPKKTTTEVPTLMGGLPDYSASDEQSSLNSVSYVDAVFDSNPSIQSSNDTSPASAENMMWQLFNTQVSMEWFDSDLIAMNQGVGYP